MDEERLGSVAPVELDPPDPAPPGTTADTLELDRTGESVRDIHPLSIFGVLFFILRSVAFLPSEQPHGGRKSAPS
jgi:hypothetical protein